MVVAHIMYGMTMIKSCIYLTEALLTARPVFTHMAKQLFPQLLLQMMDKAFVVICNAP